MSITGAFSNALSGLTAASRAAELVSSNLANAMTEGYGPRELTLAANGGGSSGGVKVAGVSRRVDAALVSDLRFADASAAQARGVAEFYQQLEQLIGQPGAAGDLTGRLTAFEADLVSAASRPDSATRLTQAAGSAIALVQGLNAATQGLQEIRQRAEDDISTQIASLNSNLQRVSKVNRMIVSTQRSDLNRATLEDQRQALVDRISSMVPVRELPRENGAIALISSGGALLLDGRAAELSFTQANVINAEMTQATGGLSGIHIDGVSIPTDAEYGAITGGTLGAAFMIRDDLAPRAQAQLDAMAQDLIERTQSGDVDSTLGIGDPGLFTDNGNRLIGSPHPGLAGRITVNSLADPAQGGAAWRLRDGLGASTPGLAGDGGKLGAMIDALNLRRPAPPAVPGATDGSAVALASEIGANFGSSRQRADTELSFAVAQHQGFHTRFLEQGVDSDAQMQKLLQIEQSYSANARVLQALDDMMQTLMRL